MHYSKLRPILCVRSLLYDMTVTNAENDIELAVISCNKFAAFSVSAYLVLRKNRCFLRGNIGPMFLHIRAKLANTP